MSNRSTHPDPTEFASFMRGELADEQRAIIDQHVSDCDTCQKRLQQTAAEAEWWDDAESFLSDDMIDDELAELDSAIASGTETRRPRPDVRTIVAWLDPTDDPRMLGRLAGYEIAGVIGSGGMGVVLKGLDTALNRYVAIKVLAPHLASSGAARQRFAREAQAAAAVVHDNVIAIHGVSEANDLPYLVMPYIRGISLQRRIDDNGPLSVSEVLRIGMQTAAGLAAAHAQGLVHRDIKPANILLDGTTERVLLTDFGLARAADDATVTHSGVIAGTPHYMSPEQTEGEGIDHRSDLFSLGSVLFAAGTGRPPFRAETSWGILKKVAESKSPLATDVNSEIPVWLSSIIRRLHQKSPAQRIQSADELHNLLAECLAHVQHPTQHALPFEYASVQRSGWLSLAKRLSAIAGVVLLAWGVYAFVNPEKPKTVPEMRELVPSQHSRKPDKDVAMKADPTAPQRRAADNRGDVPQAVDKADSEFAWDDGTDLELQLLDKSIHNSNRIDHV